MRHEIRRTDEGHGRAHCRGELGRQQCAQRSACALHVANLTRMATRCDRVEYLERLDSAEGRMSGMMVRAEWERRNGATAAPEAAGGAQTCAELPADVSGEKTAQIAGNLEQEN